MPRHSRTTDIARRGSNRIRSIAAHGYRYAFDPVLRLSEDLGVSPSTVGRLMRGDGNPTPERMRKIASLLSADLRLSVPLRASDVFSPDGRYDEPSVCALCECDGCSLASRSR